MVLEDRSRPCTGARPKLAAIIADTFPNIASKRTPLSRTEFKQSLMRIAKDEPDAAIKASLTQAAAF